MSVPLSVVILTHNESDTIERAVRSVLWADEVILIDHSTDATVEIAKRTLKTVRVIKESAPTVDFARLRNLGLSRAVNEWVLFLDADEEVPSLLVQEIKNATEQKEVVGYFLKRRDFFLGKWLEFGETGDLKLLKLAKKHAGVWSRSVHEVWQVKGSTGELITPLRHYPHPTVAEFVSRINRWTTMDAQVFYDLGVRSSFGKVLAYPVGKFVKNYIVKQGYRDGMPGLIMAMLMSFHSFLTRAKLYFLQTA